MVVLFFFYNVYIFMLNRDADFQNVVSRTQQLDADRAAESLKIQFVTTDGGGDYPIIINCTLVNDGSVPIQVMRIWLRDLTIPSIPIANASLVSQNIVLKPGATIPATFTVNAPGALASHSFTMTLITSRANSVWVRIYGV